MESDWVNLGQQEVSIVGEYIKHEAPNVHPCFGGPFPLDTAAARFQPFQPYLQLQEALQAYIPVTLGLNGYKVTSWDDTCAMLLNAEKGFKDGTKGRWQSIWYRMGNSSEILTGWTELIPEAYGLAVVKTGLALVFKLSANSAEKRNKILDTFSQLSDLLKQMDPKRARFRTSQEVAKAADELYETIVDSVEKLVLVTAKDSSWRKFMPKFRHRKAPSLDAVLANLEGHIQAFSLALDLARDLAIEGTAIAVASLSKDLHYTRGNTDVIRDDVRASGATLTHMSNQLGQVGSSIQEMKHGMEEVASEVLRTNRLALSYHERQELIAGQAWAQMQNQLDANNKLMIFVLEEMKKSQIIMAENAKLKQQLTQSTSNLSTRPSLTFDSFCELLVQPAGSGPIAWDDIEAQFQHPNEDLAHALSQKSRFNAAAQGQVQSVLSRDRFRRWLGSPASDLVIVNASLPGVSYDRLSVTSIFCATLAVSLIKMQPNDVVTRFFCGLHDGDDDDPWSGPNGLARSIIMQMVLRLVEMRRLSLDFIDHDDDDIFYKAFASHDLDALCTTLYTLLFQLPEGTRVFCLVDAVLCFDREETVVDIRHVLKCLETIVLNEGLPVSLKILFLNQTRSTGDMLDLMSVRDDLSRVITLGPGNPMSTEISDRVVVSHLTRRT